MRPGRQLTRQLAPALWALLSAAAFAGNAETDVKAAFIYNFTKFVEWPVSALPAGTPLQLCLLGRDNVSTRLHRLQGREAQGRPLQVRALDSLAETAGCHLLYVAGDAADQPTRLLKQLDNAPVLTVSDHQGFATHGGMIELFVESSRVQFSINLVPAQAAGLQINARMLQLARVARRAEK
ncbi:MAG: YfiR family protein [Gammaproteobacteria bacterium]